MASCPRAKKASRTLPLYSQAMSTRAIPRAYAQFKIRQQTFPHMKCAMLWEEGHTITGAGGNTAAYWAAVISSTSPAAISCGSSSLGRL